MGFFSNIALRGKFNQKLMNVSTHRNKLLMTEIERQSVHPFFSIIPMYLGAFYQGVMKDDNAKKFFEIMAEATEQQIDAVNRLLTVWFFWSTDRLMNIKVIEDESVTLGFSKIWSLSNIEFNNLVSFLDSCSQGEDILYLWGKIEEVLNRGNRSPEFVLPHIRNAMVSVLKNGS
ncbi:MAG: hypothetical protein NTV48_00735 [Candidatus Vogelbacteria bacterium]|nr:hypothetical protein [Candidatus Vogelbacteria bacterium]